MNLKSKFQRYRFRVIALFLLLLCIVPQGIKPMAIAAQLTWWAIKSEAVRQLCKAVPGLATAIIVKNVMDVTNGISPSMEISQQAMDALKNAHIAGNASIVAPVQLAQVPAGNAFTKAVATVQSQQPAFGVSGQLMNVAEQAHIFGNSRLSYLQWTPGRNAFEAFRSQLISSVGQVPKLSDCIGFSMSVDGQSIFNKLGTSGFSFDIGVGTSANRSVISFMHGVHQQKADRIFVYKALDVMPSGVSEVHNIASAIKPLIHDIEQQLIRVINSNPNLIQSGNLVGELGAVAQYCERQMREIEILYGQKVLSQIEASGLHSLYAESLRTVQNLQGALCDSSGNLIGIRTIKQKEMLGRILYGHCDRFGYAREAIEQRCAQITDPVFAAVKDARVSVPILYDTPFNRDLQVVVNNMRAGCPEYARAIIEKYNPGGHHGLSNWWHNRHVLYDTMQSAYQESLQGLYNADGIFKAYEQHPLWEELSVAMRENPGLRGGIIDKLRYEHAYSLQELSRIGIPNPSQDQLSSMYQLCQFSELQNFDSLIRQMNFPGDLNQTLQQCMHEHGKLSAIRESIGCPDALWHRLMGYQDLIKAVSLDPHFKTIMQSLAENPAGLPEVLDGLSARLDAAQTLIRRCGITNPSALSNALAYQLLDNYHDVPSMLEILSHLDLKHADPLVRAAYHDFFDEQGLQKLLPMNDQVRALVQDRLTDGVSLLHDPVLRKACNQLAMFNVSSPDQLDVIRRGLNFVQEASSSAPHAGFMRDFASQFAQGLAYPEGPYGRALGAGDLVESFLQPMPDDIRVTGLEYLSRVLDTSLTYPLHQDLHQGVLEGLEKVCTCVQRGDLATAERFLDEIKQLRLPNVVPVASIDMQHNPFSLPAQAGSSGWQERAKGVALAGLMTEVLRNGIPDWRPAQSQQAKEAVVRRLLRERISQIVVAKSRSQDLSALARELLHDGKVIATTTEGVVVALPDEIFAHVGSDGSVDMMAAQFGHARSFADDLQDLAQRLGEESFTRSSVLETARAVHADVQSHVPEPVSSSSSDVGESESLGDVIARLAKEHAKRAQQSSKAVSSSAGGAPPPNDPRNNRNKNNGHSRFENETIEGRSERLSRAVDPIEKKECISIVEQMGFVRIKEFSHGNAIFRKGRIYLSFDADNHNGGVWKMADSVSNLKGRATRMGTYDKLLRRIGD